MPKTKGFHWEVTSYLKDAERFAEDQLEGIIAQAVDEGERAATDYLRPGRGVASGELESRIYSRSHGLRGEVVSPAAHSRFVNFGTEDTKAIPYMRRASNRMRKVVRDELGRDFFTGFRTRRVRSRARGR